MYNKANQHQSLRSLDSLAVACFVHGFAICAQKKQQQVCRCLQRSVATNMKVILLITLVILSVSVRALEICIAPIPVATDGDRSLSNPTGRDKPYSLSVHINDRVIQQGLVASDCFEYSNDKNVKVVIKDHDKAIESFFVDPINYQNGACIWFKSLYDTWSVWGLKDSKHLCVVSTEQGQSI